MPKSSAQKSWFYYNLILKGPWKKPKLDNEIIIDNKVDISIN